MFKYILMILLLVKSRFLSVGHSRSKTQKERKNPQNNNKDISKDKSKNFNYGLLKNKIMLLRIFVFYVILISPSLIHGNIIHGDNNETDPVIQDITIENLSIQNSDLKESSKTITVTKNSNDQRQGIQSEANIPYVLEDTNRRSENVLSTNGFTQQSFALTNQEIEIENHGCVNPVSDILLVDHGQYKAHIFAAGFSYDTISETEFASITPEEILQYRMVLMEPNWLNYTALRSGIVSLRTALQISSCLVAAIRVGSENLGSFIDIDVLGTDYDDTYWHDGQKMNVTHPFITADPWGGTTLKIADFNGWTYTDVGLLLNPPTSQLGYNQILYNTEVSIDYPTMLEYDYGQGHVIVDSMSSLNGGWGIGNAQVAENYIKYMEYVSYLKQKPIVRSNPGNLTYNEFTTGNNLAWQVFDSDAKTYEIWNSTDLLFSDFWTSGSPIIHNIDNLRQGLHNITIVLVDTIGHVTKRTSWITVRDGTAPVFQSNPSTISIASASVNNELIWNVIDDEFPDIYGLYIDGFLEDFGPWQNNVDVKYNIDHLTIGEHNITMLMFDWAENIAINAFNVTVIDDVNAPNITGYASDVLYEEGDTGKELVWKATDTFPNSYVLKREGIEINASTWTDNFDLTFNVDGLPLGDHFFTIELYDTSGLSTIDSAIVTVSDRVKPLIISKPNDYTYESGTSGHTLQWVVSDNHPELFSLLRNGSYYITANWISDNPFEIGIDNLDIGLHNFTIAFNDTSGNIRNDFVLVMVEDTSDPLIDNPTDLTIEKGIETKFINWTATDLNPFNFVVYDNDSQIFTSGNWISNEIIQINLDGLTLGSHNFTIQVWDSLGNSEVDTVLVSVTDSIYPVLNEPSDINYELGDLLNQIFWIGTDANADIYSITLNESLLITGTWTSGNLILINVDDLGVGTHNFTITIFDIADNRVSNTVLVIVSDNVDPTINNPNDVSYEFGSTQNDITWIGSDKSPGFYEVLINDQLEYTGGWSTDISIIIDVDGLQPGLYTYQIILYDGSNNSKPDIVVVTVSDNTFPLFTSKPSDLTYSNGTIGNNLIWVATDLAPSNYTVYRDGEFVVTGSWVSSGYILEPVDGLSVGAYIFNITISDSSGNIISDEVTITVASEAVFTYRPPDLAFTNNSDGNELIWVMEDSSPDSYILYINEVVSETGTWSSGNPYKKIVDTFVIGIYNYTLWVNDTDGNVIIDKVEVIVTDSPQISTPNDVFYNEGVSGYSITWNATDTLPDNYTIYIDGIINQTGVWVYGANITIPVDGLIKGIYVYKIIFTDESGNSEFDEVSVTVYDITAPTFDTPPNDVTFNEGVTGKIITWIGEDLHPSTYEIWNSTDQITSGSWSSNGNKTYDLDGLFMGIYNFTIILYDTSGNFINHTVLVTVLDGTDPVITHPDDLAFTEISVNGKLLNWTVTDVYNDSYIIYENELFLQGGTWNDGENVSISLGALLKGTYNYTIVVYDTSGRFAVDMVEIIIIDTTDPWISEPVDNSYFEGIMNNNITWIGIDNNPHIYVVRKNGVHYLNGTWESGQKINITLDGLTIGVYTFTITLNDTSNNFIFDTVIISITDNTGPDITEPVDISYSEGSPNNNITWIGTELHPDKYVVTANGTIIDSGIWENGVPIVVDIDGLIKGTHIIIIRLNDTSNNEIAHQVILTVNDTTDPDISNPSDKSYSVGSEGNTISWTGTDTNPHMYVITKNGAYNTSGIWSSGNPIILDIDGLEINVYTFVITINDTSNNFVNHTVIITVNDVVGPGLSHPADIYYDDDSVASYEISWIAADSLPDTYVLTKDGMFNSSGSWTSGLPIVIDVSGLSLGSYTFVLSVNDTTGNISNDTVYVIVRKIDISSPSDIVYAVGSTGNNITWIPTDGNPNTYEIYLNDVWNSSEIWASGIPIVLGIDGLPIGIYKFNITISDSSGNLLSDVVMVDVVDGTPPSINTHLDIEYELGSSGNIIHWIATDDYYDIYEIWNSTHLLDSRIWTSGISIDYNIDGLELGIYNFTIIVRDSWGNMNVDTVIVNVVDTTIPEITPSPNIHFVINPTDNWIIWNITDPNPANFTIYLGGIFYQAGDWNNTDNVRINVDGFALGEYNFEIYAQDSHGNINSSLIIVVVDETSPYFLLERPSCETPEGKNCEGITWWRTNAELYKSHFLVYVNGTPDSPVTWNDELISYDVSYIIRGFYNITIVIFDESGNSNSSTAWVTIYDGSPPNFSESPPTKIPVVEGTFGNVIEWENDDEYPHLYEIFRDGQLIFVDTWIANNTNIYNIDGLGKGTYNFTIVAYDEALNPISFTVIVTVRDATIPIMSLEPTIFEIHENNTDFAMEWIFADTHPANYSVELDGEEIFQGIWVSSNPIIVNVGSIGLTPGEYNFTLIVRDMSLNENIQSILIKVKDVVAPVFISLIPEYEIYSDEIDKEISWTVYDLHPASYSLFIDGELSVSNVWNNGQSVSLNLDDLQVGYYNITIIFSDNSNNNAIHSLFVKVKDRAITETQVPLITITNEVREGNIEIVNGTWITRFNDELIGNGSITINFYTIGKLNLISTQTAETDSTGGFELTLDYDNIPVGDYIWEIIFKKDQHETRVVNIDVSVIPHNYIVEIQIPTAIEKGKDYFITAIVYYANQENDTNLLSLNQFITQEGKAADVEVIFVVSILYSDGTDATISKSAITSSKGFAVIQFVGSETQRMLSIESISAEIKDNEFANGFKKELSAQDLPLIQDTIPNIWITISNYIIRNIIVVMLIFITLITIAFVILFTRKRIKVKFKAYLKTMDNAKIELDANLSIRAIIIQSSSGLPLYEKKVMTMDVDTTLISGLITAFSAFLGEVGREELFGFETIERQGLSITSHKGFHSRLTIISANELPLVVLDKISNAHLDIESNFGVELTSDSGEVLNSFLVEQTFENSGLNIGIFEELELNTRNIRRMKKIKAVTRNVKDNLESLKQLFKNAKENPVKVEMILDFFIERGMSDEVSARTFLLAYSYNVLTPKFE